MNVNVSGGFNTIVLQGAASAISPGDYFNISSPTNNYYVWFTYSAESGISDADVADELSKRVSAEIRVELAAGLLAQVNLQQQAVLDLIRE